MLITFFPRLWHGNCTVFNAEIAEDAEKDGDWGKATANGTAFNAETQPLDHAPRREPLGRTRAALSEVEGQRAQRKTETGERQRRTARQFTAETQRTQRKTETGERQRRNGTTFNAENARLAEADAETARLAEADAENGGNGGTAMRNPEPENRKGDGETAQPSTQRTPVSPRRTQRTPVSPRRTQRKTETGERRRQTARQFTAETQRTQRKTETGERQRRKGTAFTAETQPLDHARAALSEVEGQRAQRGGGNDCGLRISDCGLKGKRQPGVVLRAMADRCGALALGRGGR